MYVVKGRKEFNITEFMAYFGEFSSFYCARFFRFVLVLKDVYRVGHPRTPTVHT